MVAFITGPFLWITFIIFIGGSFYRLVDMFIQAKEEKVIYPYMSLKYGLRSLMHWLIPFGSKNMQMRPVMTIVTFLFHLSVVITPLFFIAHIVFFQQAWGISWWTLPELVADILTWIVIAGCLYFLGRRLLLPEVKNVTSIGDYLFLLLIAITFLTGFIAHHQLFLYTSMFVLHILSGGLLLIIIPLTRLTHMIYFFFTRAYMGSEFGYVRNSKDW